MKKLCGCGIIVEEPRGWLLCHATNCGNRWDLPKGNAEWLETHLECALRELYEETDLVLTVEQQKQIKDLGQHPYQDHRDLHLFYVKIDKIDVKSLRCTSLVINTNKEPFPEMDAFAVFPLNKVTQKLGKRIGEWIIKNTELLDNTESW